MRKIKIIFLTLVLSFTFSLNVNSKPVPASFADLAEKLMPSVVNISTTTTITTNTNPFPFQFPPGSPFEDMFKEFGTPQERQSAALGSGFIIDEKGIVVTNNHVIQDADDIIVITIMSSASWITCLLYTSPSPRDQRGSRMPSSA